MEEANRGDGKQQANNFCIHLEMQLTKALTQSVLFFRRDRSQERTMWISFLYRATAMLVAACVLAACTTAVQPGMSRDDVLARMGQPSRTLQLGNGTRLQYSRQPAGQQVFNVDLDANGRVVQFRQMLVAPEFARIAVGQWTREDVERAFGPPASIDHVTNWPTDIMTYRWFDVQDMFFWIYLDQNNIVRRTEPGVEYHHDD
jgi:hypothetical protein